jgi:hypothetical protein
MKFKQYLNEGRSVTISQKKAIDEIGDNCVKNFRFFLSKKE